MSNINTQQIKALRERTGLGMLDCKKALTNSQGDIEKAIEYLRKNSQLKAAKKSTRTAAEGKIYIITQENLTVAVEINCETDFAAGHENFSLFATKVVEKLVQTKETDVNLLMKGPLENDRAALIQKMGENIHVRRAFVVEGSIVGSYLHSNGKIAALTCLESGDETVARDIAMHVTAENPLALTANDIPLSVREKEEEIIRAQPDMTGKPANIVDKMVAGRINKFLKENSLKDQSFIKNPEITIGQHLEQNNAILSSFIRIEVGEGIYVEQVDFAKEVAKQINKN